ncbi:MAG: DUF6506 family protein [Rhodocyclaceae bacterium]
MKVNAAFLFVAPEVDRTAHRSVVDTPVVCLTVVGVKDYEEAREVALELVEQGVEAIELCAGFGHEGAAIVAKAVQGRAAVGVVRFDSHPGFGFKSGDALFQR